MSATLRLDGTGAGAVKAIDSLSKAFDKLEKGMELSTKEAKLLEVAAGRIAKSNEQPQERYNRKIAELDKLVKSGKLSLDDAAMAASRYGKQLDTAGRAGQSLGRGLADEMRNAGVAMLGTIGLTQQLSSALQALNAERMAAAEGVKGARFGSGGLAQLAGTQDDPVAAMKQLTREQKELFAMGATENMNDAGTMLFDLKSAELSRKEQILAGRIQALGIVPAAGASAQGASGLVAAFGRDEVGSFSDVMDKALGAGKLAPGSVDRLVTEVASKVGSPAASLGLSDEFAFALTAVLAKPSGSVSEGGTLGANMLRSLEKNSGEEFRGMSGIQIVENLKSKNLTTRDDLRKYFGDDAQAIQGFQLASKNIDLLKQTEADVYTADRENRLNSAIRAAETDPSIRARLGAQISKNKLELGQGREADAMLLVDDILDTRFDQARKTMPGPLTEAAIGASRFQVGFDRSLGRSNLDILAQTIDDQSQYTSMEDRSAANELLHRNNELIAEQNALLRGGALVAPRPSGRRE